MATADFLTVSLENQFAFKCPIFDTEVQMRGCVLLRDKVYHGDKIQTRRGCQACIRSSKCPAAEIVRRIAFQTGDATDHCASQEKKVGRLPADVLERVAAVIVPEGVLSQHGVTSEERDLIRSSNDRIVAQIGTAPRTKVEARVARQTTAAPRSASRSAIKTAPAPEPTLNKAAATGDLAAALNA